MQHDERTVAQDSRHGGRRRSRGPHRGPYRETVMKHIVIFVQLDVINNTRYEYGNLDLRHVEELA